VGRLQRENFAKAVAAASRSLSALMPASIPTATTPSSSIYMVKFGMTPRGYPRATSSAADPHRPRHDVGTLEEASSLT